MSDLTQVLFNKPICIEIDAPKVEQPLGHPDNRPYHFTYQEIRELTTKYIEDGWDERAVVVKVENSKWNRQMPIYWGVVIDLNRQCTHNGSAYVPLKVKWCANGTTSEHWPEDLWLVHPSMSLWDFDKTIGEQEHERSK